MRVTFEEFSPTHDFFDYRVRGKGTSIEKPFAGVYRNIRVSAPSRGQVWLTLLFLVQRSGYCLNPGVPRISGRKEISGARLRKKSVQARSLTDLRDIPSPWLAGIKNTFEMNMLHGGH